MKYICNKREHLSTPIKREIITFNNLYDHSTLENRRSLVWNVLRVNHEVVRPAMSENLVCSFVWLFEENTKATNTKPNLTACDRTVLCNIFKNCVYDI